MSSLSRSTGDIVRGNKENEQRLISQLTLKRNDVLLKLKAVEQGENLESSRKKLEDLAKELDRHLAAVNEMAYPTQNNIRNNDIPSTQTKRGSAQRRTKKRPAPSPPVTLRKYVPSTTSSFPDIRNVPEQVPERPNRHRLKKSLSLSNSKNILQAMISSITGRNNNNNNHSGNNMNYYTLSKSHDYLDLAPLDQEQHIANAAAVRAKQRRNTLTNKNNSNRSLSAEPRQRIRNKLELPSTTERNKYTPRSPSPLTMRYPQTPRKPPTGFRFDLIVDEQLKVHLKNKKNNRKRYYVEGVSDAALKEIELFEKLIEDYFLRQASLPERF